MFISIYTTLCTYTDIEMRKNLIRDSKLYWEWEMKYKQWLSCDDIEQKIKYIYNDLPHNTFF